MGAYFAHKLLVVILVAAALAAFAVPTEAAFNPEINYQGKLTNNDGLAVPDGTYAMTFKLYTAPTGGTPIWTESDTGAEKIAVKHGLFSVMLGSTTVLTGVNFDQTLYLGVAIATDTEMTPRKVLGTVPAAFVAEHANDATTVGGVASTSFLRRDQAGTASGLLTFQGGIVSTASSTITSLTTLTATTTYLVVDGERFNDLTGTGLQNAAGVLTVNTAYLDTRYASTTQFDTCSEFAAIMTGESGTCGSVVLSASPTFTGTVNMSSLLATASSTLGGVSFPGDGIDMHNNRTLYNGNIDLRSVTLDDGGSTGIAGAVLVSNGDGTSMWANTLQIMSGGTGAGNAADARTNLGLGSLSTQNTINNGNWSGTALSVVNGGTGASTLAGLLLGNGTSAVTGITTSSGLAGALSDETGSGSAVFSGSPTLTGMLTAAAANFSGNVGIGSTTPSAKLVVNGGIYGGSGMNLNGDVQFGVTDTTNYLYFKGNQLNIAEGGVNTRLVINSSGNVGIGTTTPAQKLTVAGNLRLTGALYDSTNSAGSDGYLLQSTATGQKWVATSTLGIGGGGSSLFTDSGTTTYLTSLTDNLAIGTTSGSAKLTVAGNLRLTGALYDSLNSAGSNGYLLQSTATGQKWVATSTLGIGGGGSSLFTDGGATTYLASLTDNLAIGSTSASAKLGVNGGNILQTAYGNPTLKGTYDTSGTAFGVIVSGRYAYVADGSSGLQIIDISNPASSSLVGTYNTSGTANHVIVSGGYAYVADGSSGLQIIDISNPVAPSLAGTYNTSGYAQGVTVSGSYAYVADNTSGLEIIDITNPVSPSLVGTYYHTSDNALGVSVSGKYAYETDDFSGLKIINISNPAAPSLVGTYNTSGEAYSVAVSGRYAYVADGGSGLEIIDISNPASPSLIGAYSTSGSANGVAVSGKYVYVAEDFAAQIIDISNPAAPSLVGTYVASDIASDVTVSGKYAYVADGSSGLEIIDINGAEFPTLTAGNIEAGTLNATENLIVGNDIYAQGGLNVGLSGIFSRGGISSATGTSAFLGNVGIGTTTPSTALTVKGTITPATDNVGTLGNSSSRWNAVYATNGTIQTSDERLKTNIQPLNASTSLSELLALNPVTFNWKNPAFGTSTNLGFIAQQVEPIVPDAVTVGDDADHTLGLTYTQFIPLIVSGFKELDARVSALTAHFVDGVLTATGVRASYLCLGDTCITQTELQDLLDRENVAAQQPPVVPAQNSSTTPSTTPPQTDEGAAVASSSAGAAGSGEVATSSTQEIDANDQPLSNIGTTSDPIAGDGIDTPTDADAADQTGVPADEPTPPEKSSDIAPEEPAPEPEATSSPETPTAFNNWALPLAA